MGIRIKDIAMKSGFGYGTVARALNDTPYLVKDKTREKILRIAEKNGYVRDLNAQALRKRKTTDIGLVIPAIFGSAFYNDYYIKLIAGVIDAVSSYSHKLRLFLLEGETGFQGIMKDIRALKPAGVIYSSIYYGDFKVEEKSLCDLGIPIAVLNEHIKGENIRSVILDDFKGGYDGTDFLIRTGHKEIGIIRGIQKDIEKRFDGYKQAMVDNGLRVNDKYVMNGDGTEITGYRETLRLLGGDDIPTAIFGLDDEMAVGALRAIKEKGLKCPEDISVLGYDGMDISGFAVPRLTTMVRPVSEMGKQAVRILLEKEKFRGTECVKIEAKLLERESCRNR